MSYLTIAPGTKKDGQKTYTYCVFALASSVFLGIVKWRPGWRKYVFEPQPDTVFDCGCLREMADFLDQQTTMQKRKREIERQGETL